jgi:hypothetical protein
MKILVGMVLGLIGSAVLVLLDINLVKFIFTLVPQSDWSGLIKVAVVFVDIWFTGAICILPFVFGFMIGGMLER